MRYRLALDLGTTSLGWAMVQLDKTNNPNAIIKAGVRIFSDGREPAGKGQIGTSLAATRRAARAMRRRRDRLLKRKVRMEKTLIDHGFFPANEAERKALVTLNPYDLRAKGLDKALTPAEFARAIFHINQRRGFKSNRKTDKGTRDAGALKTAISQLQKRIAPYPNGENGKPLKPEQFDLLSWVNRGLPETNNDLPRTVGELLNRRLNDTTVPVTERTVRARNNGLKGGKLVYDLYIDRAMIEAEFDALWAKQASIWAKINTELFNTAAHDQLKDCLLHQRPLKPVKPGRCTLLPDEERAPLALPSMQRFRIYQEVNNLRVLREGLKEEALTLQQRDALVVALEANSKRSFTQIKKLLGVGGTVQFNFEDPKRQELKGNTTSAILSKDEHFGRAWFAFDEAKQDAVVLQLVSEENEAALVQWLQAESGVDERRAEALANVGMPEGYGSLSSKALARILPKLREVEIVDGQTVIRTYDKAVLAAGFEHHSRLSEYGEVEGRTFDTGIERINRKTGEIQRLHAFTELPYYGEYLQRHVGFVDPDASPEQPEKYFGKIANPTVHIGLNQARVVVNALLKRYGHPSEVIIEVASELKRPTDHRPAGFRFGKINTETMRRYCSCAGCINVRQAINQDKNKEFRAIAETVLGRQPKSYDMEKMRLWDDIQSMSGGIVQCPYSGITLGIEMILSHQVEIDHIFPHQKTLDDSLLNKVLCTREANRIKKDRSPAQAKDDFLNLKGWRYEDIEARVRSWDQAKRSRFQEGALEKWLGEENSFLPRALNDTRYLSRLACEYLRLVCPQDTRAIPGQMTSKLRKQFGLDEILGIKGIKNRDDHRHHAVDACVIGITDAGLLQRFAQASASAREQQLNRLVDDMQPPWPTYREHVERAVNHILVSHKPDHGYEGPMFDATIYSASGKSSRAAKDRTVIPFQARKDKPSAIERHGSIDGIPNAYKGLLPNSNYCIEIFRTETGTWDSAVLRTFDAYQIVRDSPTRELGIRRLRNPYRATNGNPLVMRLMINDYIRIKLDDENLVIQVLKINSSGSITLIKPNETNISARYNLKLAAQKAAKECAPFDEEALNDVFFQRAFGVQSLRDVKARRVTISPIGELLDPGFKE